VNQARRLALGLIGACLVALLVAACGSNGSPAPAGSASGPFPSLSGVGPPVTLPPGATPLVRIDTSLLGVFPTEVDGLSVLESSQAEAAAQANGTLASLSDGVAGALAIDPATGDFVIADVVRVRQAVLDDAGFTSWRNSFDNGVCAGTGVIGHAQQTIGGRTVFVGSCGNGFHTYHAWIKDKNLLVSASAGGKRELGPLLFQNLTP
jgi:hypothetical protein